MARPIHSQRDDDQYLSKSRRKGRRFKKRYLLLGFFLFLIGFIGVGVPYAASNRALVVSMANRFAGIAPNRIDLDKIEASWFSPLRVEGFRLSDERGTALIQVGSIETTKGIFSFAIDSRHLGTIEIKDSIVQIDVQPGTTNIEEALRPLLQSSPSSPSHSTTAMPTGNLKISNASIKAMDTVDLQGWMLTIQEAEIPLPSERQPIPLITAKGAIQPLVAKNSSPSADGFGEFTIRLEPSLDAVQVNAPKSATKPIRIAANVSGIPLQLLSLAKRRMPELPFERISGKGGLQADVTMLSPNDWIANINQASIDTFHLFSPSLLGKQPAEMQRVTASGKFSFNSDRVIAEKTMLDCDVGQWSGSASLPLPLPMPTATHPWIDHAELDMAGSINMASLVKALPGLIAMQDQTQLLGGQASITAIQKMNQGSPVGRYQVKLGDLVANVHGTKVTWDQAFGVELEIQPGTSNPNGTSIPRFVAKVDAEFCKLDGQGDLGGGQLHAVIDLDRMQKRLSNWFVLPFTKLAGNAECKAVWKQDATQRVQLNGTLVTSPLRIGLSNGLLSEPAWNGKFDLLARMVNNSISQVDRASMSFTSEEESIQLDVLEPIAVAQIPNSMQPLPAAGVSFKMKGDLGAWQKRGQMIAAFDPGFMLSGRCSIEAKGQADLRHVEITNANWTAQPLAIQGAGFSIQESQVNGEFSGRIDSQAIQRLQVEKLMMTSSCFGITAMDAPASNGTGRQGKAAFRIDPRRLLASMESATSSSPTTTSVEGDVTGMMNWTIDNQAITWQLESNGKDIRVVQLTPRGPGTLASTANASPSQLLWSEPAARATMLGRYILSTGAIELPEMQLQTEWLAYAGQTTLTNKDASTNVTAKGQMTYDAGRVAERLRPWLGNYLTIAGQRTEPVELTWVSTASGNWADSLQAKTRIGWDTANVIGIDVGKADVPISIENGHLRSKTEIPVSQGSLRWNLDGDVGSDPIIIHQAPEVVLDNVAITPMMCQGWLKYVAPLLAEVTKVEGKLSLRVDQAQIVPTDIRQQKFSGQLQLHGATVGPGPLADQLLAVAQQIRAMRKGTTAVAANANSNWLQMPQQNIDFSVDSGRVVHKNLQFAAGDVVIQTSGDVSIDGQLQMMAQIPIRKEWIDSTPLLASLEGQSLQLPITGTLQKPQVDFRSIGALTAQMAQGAAQGYLQKQFDKGFNKLLGPMQQGLQQFQQGLPQGLSIPQGILPGPTVPQTPQPPATAPN